MNFGYLDTILFGMTFLAFVFNWILTLNKLFSCVVVFCPFLNGHFPLANSLIMHLKNDFLELISVLGHKKKNYAERKV